MKKFYSFITSLPFTAFLFLVLAFAMAIATFIESSYGTSTARALVYNTHWFEVLWILFGINLVNNLFKFKFFSKKKFSLALFHLSFIAMILGAGVTRYFSYEGVMHIRENESANFILSSDDYFYAGIEGEEEEKRVRFSEITPKQFSETFDVGGQEIKVKTIGFIKNAEKKAIASGDGSAVIDFVFLSPAGQGMQSLSLQKGDALDFGGFSVGFETLELQVNFFADNDNLFMVPQIPVAESSMMNEESIAFEAGDTIAVKKRYLYNCGDYRFLVREFYPKAIFTAVKSQVQTNTDAVLVQITDGEKQKTIPVFGRSRVARDTINIPLEKGTLHLAYGAVPLYLPFSIYLKDFKLERYPGSQSPSSFASDVVLNDPGKGINKDIRIFMNNTLSHGGYKFFQSSYDTDEGGTVLSVNHDFWGTWITYFGYAILILGIALAMLSKNSHFQSLIRKLKQSSAKAAILVFVLCSASFSVSAQKGVGAGIPAIDKQIVDEFSRLWVQGVDGRIEPVSTLSGEIVRKVSRKSSLFGKSPDEVILSMMVYPELWQTVPIIKVSNKTLAEKLGADDDYITIQSLFDGKGNYSISDDVRAAYAKTPSMRNRVEKELIYVDERVNICFMVFQGSSLNLFPRAHKEDTWYAPGTQPVEYAEGDSLFIKSGFQLLVQSITGNNTTDALQVLKAVANFQTKYGKNLLESDSKKNTEILYNKINPFKRIFPFYLAFGFILLLILFVNIFRQKSLPGYLKVSFFILIFILFLVHTAGLVLRWYISGHAPWSNGFESVVYVAWASMLAGLIFGKKYPMVVGTAAFLSGITLFVAHLSWMNPEVTNLVPVLKSYWLTLHVAIITASYGFIGLSMFLGILVMILMALRNKANQQKVSGIISQLTTINEMSATIGLYFLTIGTFLGAIWANESWGRYWGWDPKETWSLITILVYSFIVHMRLVPSLKGVYSYNLASIIGFVSVLMTYFGVNYYLTGLHSYGSGIANGINPAVPVVVLVLIALMVWAHIKDLKFRKETAELQ